VLEIAHPVGYLKNKEIQEEGRKRKKIVALNIKNDETERLARELARRRKQGITEVVTEALRKELERERRKPPRKESYEEFKRGIDEIVERFNKLPVLDDRSADEIIGYNEKGHFD
jgi:antitoxin VapB